ncbi:MAG TPA: hypothetical protein VI362_07705 [Ignavibacteriaceae bacterium]|nr:hypothetical protein [Ignavibacteriaceae bacterium]
MIRNVLFTAFLILAVITFFGCESKTGKSDETGDDVKVEGVIGDTTSGGETAVETVTIPDLKGTWTGTFDRRATTLIIKEQTDSSFSGNIIINYRQVINQEVKGSFSPVSMVMNMTDQLHSRYQGKYDGKLSENADHFSGTFIMNRDGSKFSFNLNKK